MSRIHTQLSEHVIKTVGEDYVLGAFIQISDKRWAAQPEDIQGEGYVLDWDERFGFSINHIEATVADLGNNAKLLVLCNDFARTFE